MDNFKCSISEREQTRNDFSNEFLRDILDRPMHGHDPYNHIGYGAGHCEARALSEAVYRAVNDSLWSDVGGKDHARRV